MAGLLWKLGNISWQQEKYGWSRQLYQRARQLYQRTVETYPDSNDVIVMKSRVEKIRADIKLGDDPNVPADVNELIADYNEHPRLPWAVFVIGEEYYNEAFRLKEDDLDTEAKENFRKAIALWERIITDLPPSPITPQACYLSATCLRGLGEYEKAIEYYQNILDDWPDYENAWSARFLIGFSYEKFGKTGAIPRSVAIAATRGAYERVLQDYPACPAANAARNWLNYNKKVVEGEQK